MSPKPGEGWFGSAHSAANEEAEAYSTHCKRLAMILRYIATMHHSANVNMGFLRECEKEEVASTLVTSDFLAGRTEDQDGNNVFLSTMDFSHLMSIVSEERIRVLFPDASPFSFYAAATGNSKRKRTLAGTIKDSITIIASSQNNDNDAACWLRLFRPGKESPPSTQSRSVQKYLQHWKDSSGASSFRRLLTLENIATAPKVAPSIRRPQEVKSFLRQYRQFLQRQQVQSVLEPMYNRLFEWLQQQSGASHDQELVWGFGNAKWVKQGEDALTVVNGPLLEVLVEVELARDGALLVRPRPHTGVSLNRQVVSAIAQQETDLLSAMYKTVSEMETSQLSPGQPSTYSTLLKRMALQLSPDGSFMSRSEYRPTAGLSVTDAWCLYGRAKPSTVWARDASHLAEQLLKSKGAVFDDENDTIPRAAWALTHGSGAVQRPQEPNEKLTASSVMFQSIKTLLFATDTKPPPPQRPLFALPTSDSQDMIADLLLNKNFPAVVCEGPPGTGKTHTIANIVCAYLCNGKRVCVTSKGAPALSVLRRRLPATVQELCVDVSLSETAGIRQLQQTVERLSDRVSCVNTEVQTEKRRMLQESIDELHLELKSIDESLESHSEEKRLFLTSTEGQELADAALSLISTVPWLLKTSVGWTLAETKALVSRVKSLVTEQEKEPIHLVTGFGSPPSDALISLVEANAGKTLAVLKQSALKKIASVPGLGSVQQSQARNQEALDAIRIHGGAPESEADWNLARRAFIHDKEIHSFHIEFVSPLVVKENWPLENIYVENSMRRMIKRSFLEQLCIVLKMKELALKHDVENMMEEAKECRALDSRRTRISSRMQLLAENMVEVTVVTELCRSFSAEAQSALIKFAQIAGRSKFSKASQPSKMSQRQRRHRQEYLDAFEKCVRYTPCWILTSSQISDYLPSECGLFDLVVIDEASQSDITVLPGMLRGKQWLIVGDGKQVSPSESFISEGQIESLRAALPETPLADSLLPGHSFFDLCSQAFPTGRVVLSEHFRCAPDLIDFSNSQFYDGRLIPLRLPTASERMDPCLIDIKVKGKKVGKTNEKECDKIVSMIKQVVAESASRAYPRSIGVISLIGDDQSRLIRGRILDAVGPQKYNEHDILVGDPPTFQGAERDVIFLSLVCSPGSVPTQNQQMNAQRANVALSRARDRMVLLRSIDSSQVPNNEDVKLPIIEFFETACQKKLTETDETANTPWQQREGQCLFSVQRQAQKILEEMLEDEGYSIRRMGVVWSDAICVEDVESSLRAAVCIDCAGEPKEEWKRVMIQQKSIERVGWRCLRVDALSFLVDPRRSFKSVTEFVLSAGVNPRRGISDEMEEEINNVDPENNDDEIQYVVPVAQANPEPIVVISSDEEGGIQDEMCVSDTSDDDQQEVNGVAPEQFGTVVGLGFLRNRDTEDGMPMDEDNVNEKDRSDDGAEKQEESNDGEHETDTQAKEKEVDEIIDGKDRTDSHAEEREVDDGNADVSLDADASVDSSQDQQRRATDSDEEYLGESASEAGSTPVARRRKKYRRLDKYSRDARWYPGKRRALDEDETPWYDTDSDLSRSREKVKTEEPSKDGSNL